MFLFCSLIRLNQVTHNYKIIYTHERTDYYINNNVRIFVSVINGVELLDAVVLLLIRT